MNPIATNKSTYNSAVINSINVQMQKIKQRLLKAAFSLSHITVKVERQLLDWRKFYYTKYLVSASCSIIFKYLCTNIVTPHVDYEIVRVLPNEWNKMAKYTTNRSPWKIANFSCTPFMG